jgi:hypothetical protein
VEGRLVHCMGRHVGMVRCGLLLQGNMHVLVLAGRLLGPHPHRRESGGAVEDVTCTGERPGPVSPSSLPEAWL